MMKETFNKTINDIVKPLMKIAGFKKSGLSFYKEQNELIFLLNFQNSVHNNHSELRFYINCCIHAKQIDSEINGEVRNQPKEHESHYRKRIEKITGRTEDKFIINTNTDFAKFNEELLNNLNKALAFMEEVNTLDELLTLMIRENGLYNYQELLSFLVKTGRHDFVNEFIKQLQQDFNKDERWPFFEQQIKEILETTKSEN